MRIGGATSYQKDPFYSANKRKVLQLVRNPKAFAEWPRKTKQSVVAGPPVIVRLPVRFARTRQVTVDDIDSFARVRDVPAPHTGYTPMPESRFKKGVARIIKEKGEFKDWGGEPNDLFYDARPCSRNTRCRSVYLPRARGAKAS